VGIAAENEKEALPKPITTNNLDISIEELEYRLSPLTKDDLSVEAGGWLQVLKKHGEELSNTQIAVLKAEGDEKTKLLENVTKLDEHKTILVDRLKLVMEEYRSKGGKVDDYEAYIKAVSGVDVKISDASAKAQKILEEILVKHAAVLKDPEPVVKVHELADSSVNFVVRPWVKTENYWDVYWDITRTVKERFDAEGVSIPFPQQDVYMHQVATT
jgi:small-conductance mechanosensitive channel